VPQDPISFARYLRVGKVGEGEVKEAAANSEV
jgi:hypothetical protein